jgi:two-component system cell cycle response regulator DivK
VILYVEDDEDSREVMQVLLVEGLGYATPGQVTIFADSTDFMTRLNNMTFKPTLILLDIHMQPFDGFQMLWMVRQNSVYANVPVIALTASVMNEEVARLRTAGFSGCIAKPINMRTFPAQLQQILKGEEIWRVV